MNIGLAHMYKIVYVKFFLHTDTHAHQAPRDADRFRCLSQCQLSDKVISFSSLSDCVEYLPLGIVTIASYYSDIVSENYIRKT